MKEDNEFIPELAKFRQKAEAKLEKDLSEIAIPSSQAETVQLIREFRLRQIELEMQIEELKLHFNPGLSTEYQHNQTILKSEEKYHEIFANMQDVYYETAINGEILEISPSVYAFSKGQYCREELIGQSISDFYTYPEERNAVLEYIHEHGRITDYELSMSNKDGSTIPVSISSKVIFDLRGIPEKIIGSVRDITRRKKSEKKIRENEANIQAIIENSLENIWSINSGYEIQYVNEQFVKEFQDTFGVKLAKGVKILDALPDPLKILWKERYDKAFKNEHFIFTDKIDLGNKIIYIEVAMNPIVLDGKVTGVALYGKDITGRKSIELEMIAAKEKAEENDRLKSAFLANMSHEIRTPLNSIIGFSELMSNPDFDQDQHFEFARMINISGNNLLSIITDIMDLSKIEAGQVQVKNEFFSASRLIIAIQNEYSYKAIQKGIELRVEPSALQMGVFLESDESKLRQILINFVGNAIKFTESGFVEIGINKTDNFCQFSVKDTGIGIPGKFHDTIFERFRQVETAHTRKYGGNGLGLAISKSLVELLGGTIWMESVYGKGSIFYFSIPVK
jgi:PAS domain S-box-containing protein